MEGFLTCDGFIGDWVDGCARNPNGTPRTYQVGSSLGKFCVGLRIVDVRIKLTHEHLDLLLRIGEARFKIAQKRDPALVFHQTLLKLERIALERLYDR